MTHTSFNPLWGNNTESNQRSGLAESPLWDDAAQCWYWIDIPKRLIHRHTSTNVHTEWQLPQNDAHDPGAMCISDDGSLVIALRAGLATFDPETHAGEIEPKIFMTAPYDTTTTRFNDGGVDALGRFWIGTLFSPKTHAGAGLYCLEKGILTAILGKSATQTPQSNWGVTTANGWAMALDGKHMYHADTQAHVIYRYDVDTSMPSSDALSNRVEFYTTPTQAASTDANIAYQGRPDGSAVDSAGNYWNAQFEGGQVIQFSATGEILQRIALTARCPTMVCFGGADLKTMLITTTGNRPADELNNFPDNGIILTMPVDVAGLPTRRYIRA